MTKTPEQKQAWLEGYRAATLTAGSFYVRTGDTSVDRSLNAGAGMVASLLRNQLDRFADETVDERIAAMGVGND